MSQLNQILEYMATLQQTITIPGEQVTAAYAYLPSDPASANCPFFVNEVDFGPVEFLAVRGFQRVVDIVNMHLCVSRFEADATLEYNVQNLALWRDAVIAKFAGAVRFANTFPFITEAYIDRWSGLVKLDYGSTSFLAMTYRLHIEEQFLLTVNP